MKPLLLAYYADDFTGATDALEQLTLHGIRAALFLEPPTPGQLKSFPGLQAVGVAGRTRSLAPAPLARELRPALRALHQLRPRHIHYKVCSTFDSSPRVGSIGRALDVGAALFRAPIVPVLAAAPALGRFTVFGHHFARYGIGSTGAIYRLDRHPALRRHPVTPMTEADLRRHLARQTRKRIALFDVLRLGFLRKPGELRSEWQQVVAEGAEVVLFDGLWPAQLQRIGELLDHAARAAAPLFSVGSSGIEAALGAYWRAQGTVRGRFRARVLRPVRSLLIGSGSCSPVTSGQIAWALRHGFAEVPLDLRALASPRTAREEMSRVAAIAARHLRPGRGVILHTTRAGANPRLAARFKGRTAEVFGAALGRALRLVLEQCPVARLCLAGGDTSSYAARALGITALEMLAPLTPGAPVCRAVAPGSPADGVEVVLKGGQVGPEDYFGIVQKGRP
jgi:uncharacterized protein YgbK (DUF1537 family)